MSRADLLALTPETLSALTNAGLVKRAQREIAGGQGPSLDEDEAGTVNGTFADGVVVRLEPDRALKDTVCSCGAHGVCRHRVAIALAYRAWAGAHAEAPPAARTDWSPGAIADEVLTAVAGTSVMDRARASIRKGVTVEIVRATAADPVPTARLPACTVRFLVPNDLAYARCDCALGTACDRVEIAAWALCRADETADSMRVLSVSLGGGSVGVDETEALDEAFSLASDVLATGVANARPDLAQRIARVRANLRTAGHLWLLATIDDIERALEDYHARSARYSTHVMSALITELVARIRASRQPGELPARVVLGANEARETQLDHVRLVSLGARVEADGRTRTARVYLADPDTATVLVLDRRWEFADHEVPADAIALSRRSVAARIRLDALAHGQVVSKVV